MLWWIFGSVFLVFISIKLYNNLTYWKRRGVIHLKAWPLLGSMPSILWKKLAIADQISLLYNEYPDSKYVGLHQFTMPVLMIRDPEIIKMIMVKDFDSFTDRRFPLDQPGTLLEKSLLVLKGQRWRDMRATLSPAFTGSKMRALSILMIDCAEQFVDHFLKEAKNNDKMVEAEMKEIFTRYANDVIATTAFGIKCDSLQDKNNDFFIAGKNITSFGLASFVKLLINFFAPWILKLTGLEIFDKKSTNFLRDSIINTLRFREREGIVRPDMIHLLMEAKKGRLKYEAVKEDSGFSAVEESAVGRVQRDNKPELTDEDIAAQALLFFFAGYDSSSTIMAFMAYEVAIDSDVQKRLQKEVDELFAKGKIDYESVLKMKYLDMVVSETLRKWPPGIMVERYCTKPYVIENTNEGEEPLVLEKGTPIWAIMYCVQRDPKYFPDPDRFDPERFSDENKGKIAPCAYFPFGVGPRNCIGSRFALLEIKILFVYLLSKFDFVVTEKTQVPIQFSKTKLSFVTERGIWLGLQPRN